MRTGAWTLLAAPVLAAASADAFGRTLPVTFKRGGARGPPPPRRQAMRTGAWTLLAAPVLAAASADAFGRTLPITFKSGRPSVTPIPRRKVRRARVWFFKSIVPVRGLYRRFTGSEGFGRWGNDQCP